MKKLAILFACVITFVFVAPSFAAPIKIVLGHPNPQTHTIHKGYEKFKELVETKTNGGIVVDIHPAGALGGDRQIAESVNIGTIQMGLNGSITMGNYDPRFYVFDLPYIFDSNEMADKILNGEIGKKLLTLIPGSSIRVIGYPENGFRNISNNKKDIKTIEDMAGLKIRLMETPVHFKAMEALGAIPTPVPFPEVYGALQTKMVDAQENSNSLFYASRFYEVQPYYTVPGPFFLLDVTIINEDFFQSLSPEYQKIVSDSALEAGNYQRELNRTENVAALDQMKEKGVKVTILSPEELEKFKTKTFPVYEAFKDIIGLEFMNEVLGTLGKPLVQ